MHDIQSGAYQLAEINACVRAAAGLDVHSEKELRDDCENKKCAMKNTKRNRSHYEKIIQHKSVYLLPKS